MSLYIVISLYQHRVVLSVIARLSCYVITGSMEELCDLKSAYVTSEGDMERVYQHRVVLSVIARLSCYVITGSVDELCDLKSAYESSEGDMERVLLEELRCCTFI